jgi:hypothetical protein
VVQPDVANEQVLDQLCNRSRRPTPGQQRRLLPGGDLVLELLVGQPPSSSNALAVLAFSSSSAWTLDDLGVLVGELGVARRHRLHRPALYQLQRPALSSVSNYGGCGTARIAAGC